MGRWSGPCFLRKRKVEVSFKFMPLLKVKCYFTNSFLEYWCTFCNSHLIRTINQKGGIEISNGVDWAFARSIHPSFELWFASTVFGMFRNSIWNYSQWLDLNSLSLFTDHPLLRVSLITSRLLPMGRPRPRDEKEEKKEEVDVDEEEEWWMWMWMRMGMRGHHACAGPPDT